jgi:hypothetical protein
MARDRLLILGLAAVIAFGGCAPANQRSEFDNIIATAAAEAGDGSTIDMAEVVSLDWDTMVTFEAYSTDDEIREAVGDSWPAGSDSRIPSDGWGLVVFLKDEQVVAWTDLNRHDPPAAVRFDQTGQAIPIQDARFVIDARDRTTSGLDILYLSLEP